MDCCLYVPHSGPNELLAFLVLCAVSDANFGTVGLNAHRWVLIHAQCATSRYTSCSKLHADSIFATIVRCACAKRQVGIDLCQPHLALALRIAVTSAAFRGHAKLFTAFIGGDVLVGCEVYALPVSGMLTCTQSIGIGYDTLKEPFVWRRRERPHRTSDCQVHIPLAAVAISVAHLLILSWQEIVIDGISPLSTDQLTISLGCNLKLCPELVISHAHARVPSIGSTGHRWLGLNTLLASFVFSRVTIRKSTPANDDSFCIKVSKVQGKQPVWRTHGQLSHDAFLSALREILVDLRRPVGPLAEQHSCSSSDMSSSQGGPGDQGIGTVRLDACSSDVNSRCK
mmetsp:Transcript_4726/g.8353  ORF Transcript_4726/g.8353 Transcript_4726/m.8353 type:complete len:341 (-) Transcript_4726:1175-2197(-)